MQSIMLMFQKQVKNAETDEHEEPEELEELPSKKLHEPFKLPIAYLDKTYELSSVVSSDLELTTSQSCT